MKRFKVGVYFEGVLEVEVEAEDEIDAQDKAFEEFDCASAFDVQEAISDQKIDYTREIKEETK